MSRASVEDLPSAPPALAALSLNGPPAGAALPGPGPVGPMAHMSAGYAPESLEDQLEGVDLRSDSDNRHQAVIHVEWKGSAEEFAGSGSIAQRTVNIGSFKDTWTELDVEDRPVDRKRAVILGVSARAVTNTFPITVAARWTDAAKNLNQLSTRRGKVAAVLAHKESSRGTHSMYMPSDSISTRHFRQYAHHTTESLRKDIVKFPHGFSYVPINSPIVQIMAKNRETLCVDLNEADMRESNYFRVDPTVVDRVLDELDRKILSRLPFVNLDDLSLQIDRTDGQPWNSPAGTPFQGTSAEQINAAMKVRHSISMELVIDYGFPAAKA